MRLLLVSPAGSYRVADFLHAVGAVGAEVVVATDAKSAIPGSSVFVALDEPDIAAQQLIEAVGPVDGVVGTDGAAVAVAAAVGRRLGLTANTEAAVAAAGDKWQQRCAAAVAGVSQPEFAVLTGDDSGGWARFPAVVKPVDRAASQGVIRVNGPAGMDAAGRQVRRIVGTGRPLLVEQFVPGVEIAVEGLLAAGHLEVLAVFDKPDKPDKAEGSTFPETLLVCPARLDSETRARVVDVANRAVAAVGLTEGPVHVECKVDGDRVWFLELAARTIGGLCSRVLYHDGVSLEELVVRHALGLPLPETGRHGASGVLMLPVEASGRLEAVVGIERARAVEGVTDVVISIGLGQEVLALPEGDRYLGFVFARADTPDAVEAALRRSWAELQVDITVS